MLKVCRTHGPTACKDVKEGVFEKLEKEFQNWTLNLQPYDLCLNAIPGGQDIIYIHWNDLFNVITRLKMFGLKITALQQKFQNYSNRMHTNNSPFLDLPFCSELFAI